MSEQPLDDLIGKTLGQYTILEEVGRGGMATVYSARQQSMNRIVAVKVLPPHLLHDPGFYERFEREVEVISTLEHPHILPIYDYGKADNVPYIAMRFLGGGSMAQMIRRGVPDLDDLERPFSQVAQALDYAHQQGIIHRDLKPGNIMLDENGNAYLSDFGIARVMGSNLTGSAIIGTPAYMSPEQANGLSIDGRSDIYSLGVVLFELITGREPYQAETPMALLLKHLNEPIPPVRDFRADVPEEVEAVINRATAKDPDDRYSSAGDMAKAFGNALRGIKDETSISSRTKKVEAGEAPTREHVPDSATITPDSSPDINAAVKQAISEQLSQSGIYGDATMQGQKRSNPVGLIALVAVVILVIMGGAILLPRLTDADGDDKGQGVVSLVPTPFRRATSITTSEYTISIPDVWVPSLSEYTDESDASRMHHVWQASDNTARVSLSIVDLSTNDIDSYHDKYYGGQADLQFIDEATAPDGTVRRSYRVEGDNQLSNGQKDVFYLERSDSLVVLELYTADSIAADSTLMNTLQLILDSLRVPPPDNQS